jgi:hypothetical protein
MPVVLRERGYRFEFYASDGSERRYMHVKKNGKHAKVWLEPEVELAFSRRCRPHEVNEVLRLVQRHHQELLEAWNDFFGGA